MSRAKRFSIGLIGQILAILLLAITIEFGVSTLLYERASRLSVRDDEAHRIAESLTVAVKLLSAVPAKERHALADQLSTDRYIFGWRPSRVEPPAGTAALTSMRLQVTAWEPSLAETRLRLRLKSPGRSNVVIGNLRLRDGTWVEFIAPRVLEPSTFTGNRIALALVPAIALTIVGALLMHLILRPIRDLSRAASKIGHGEQIHVEERGPADVRRLSQSFNEMQTRITELLDGRTRALAAVGHDLRTPIARLRLRTDMIGEPAVRAAFDRDLIEIDAMLGSLLAYFGRDAEPETVARIDIAVMMASVADAAADEGADAVYEGPDHFDLVVRRGELKRAVTNLVENAIHYGGNAVLKLEPGDDHVVLAVEDDGPGISEAQLKTVLEPFMRLDGARARNTNGLGLGLSIVDDYVRRAGGSFTIANRSEGGLRAAIVLPMAASA